MRFIITRTINNSINYPIIEKSLSVSYYSIIALISIIGNILIIYATSKVRKHSVVITIITLIKTLAINDLVGGLILYPHFILLLSLGHFPFPWQYCVFLGIFEIYFPLISTLIITTLVITKYWMMRNPFMSLRDPKPMYLVVTCIYTAGAFVPLGVFMGLGEYRFSPERGTCTYDFYPDDKGKKWFVIICTGMFVVIPMIVIVGLSVCMLKFMKKHRNKMPDICRGDSKVIGDRKSAKLLDKVFKSVFVVLLVVIAYIVCWSMYIFVTFIAFLIGGEETIPRQVLLWQKALLMTNNAVNPFVYYYGNKKIQMAVRNICLRGMLNSVSLTENMNIMNNEPLARNKTKLNLIHFQN